jgi:hypothetical protein
MNPGEGFFFKQYNYDFRVRNACREYDRAGRKRGRPQKEQA